MPLRAAIPLICFSLRNIVGIEGIHLRSGSEYVPPADHNQSDYVLQTFYPDLKLPGVVVELGALNGLGSGGQLTNRHGWRSIMIEGNPQMEHVIKKNSPKSEVHMNAICSEQRTINYIVASNPGVSGLEPIDSEKLKRWNAHIKKTLPVQCVPVSHILSNEPVVDLFILDVEGHELDVLHTFDWSKTYVKVFVIESGVPGGPVGDLMTSKGFVYHGKCCGDDYIWTKPEAQALYTWPQFEEKERIRHRAIDNVPGAVKMT